MSFNKKDNKLDFRNVKNTQFDPGQVSKMAFSELKSAFRHYETNAILNDAYTHFIQEVNVDGKPTKVTYYQASHPATDRLNVAADSGGSLAGTYFTLQEFITKKTHVFWFNVSGSGSAPGIGDIEHEVVIATNDPASVVAFAVKGAIENTEEFYVKDSDLLTAYVDIEYYQFGETQAIDLGTSGFLSNRLIEGQSFEVGEVCLDYDSDGHPIYNGNTLKGLLYNAYTASFDVERDRLTVDVDMTPLIAKEPTIYNISMPVAGTEYSLVLPLDTKQVQAQIQDHKGKYYIKWASGGPVWTKKPGSTYEVSGLELDATNNILYFEGTKNNIVIEIITWK